MTTLNFIYPERSDIKFTTMVFPDGQPHLKVDMASLAGLDLRNDVAIVTRISSTNDLLLALLAKNVLGYEGFERVELHISYLMGARMDRVMQDGEPFSLKVIAGIINGAGFKKVLIFDPHSEVATAVIDRSYTVTNHRFVKDAVDDYLSTHKPASYCIASPDAGALKKIYKLAQYLDIDNIVECSKVRDLKTGALSGFKTSATDLTGQTCIIVDDICDGGGTFTGTAAVLKAVGAAHVVLIVSHGIFSKGINIAQVDAIYSTDSYRCVEGVKCFEVGKYLRDSDK
ncbi:MAG: ribose-phosphate diphosphokinase [Bacteroidota bacterium]